MTVAKSAGSILAYIAEATYGVTPSTPAFKNLVFEGESLGFSRGSLADNSINSTRNRVFHGDGNKKTAGGLNGNFIYSQWDDFLAAAMFSSWNAVQEATVTDATTLTITGVDKTAVYPVGMKVVLYDHSGSGIDNGDIHTISASSFSTDTTLTVDTMGASSGTVKIAAFVINGKTMSSFSLIKKITSTASELPFVYSGMVPGSFDLEIKSEALLKASFNFLGKDEDTTEPSGATYSDITDLGDNPLNSYSGFIKEAGTESNIITSLKLKIENNLEALYAIGSDAVYEVAEGPLFLVSGSLSMYIENLTQYDKFRNGTHSSLIVQLTDPASGTVLDDTYHIILPDIKFTGNSAPIGSQGAIINDMPFEALATGSGANKWTMLVSRWAATDS